LCEERQSQKKTIRRPGAVRDVVARYQAIAAFGLRFTEEIKAVSARNYWVREQKEGVIDALTRGTAWFHGRPMSRFEIDRRFLS